MVKVPCDRFAHLLITTPMHSSQAFCAASSMVVLSERGRLGRGSAAQQRKQGDHCEGKPLEMLHLSTFTCVAPDSRLGHLSPLSPLAAHLHCQRRSRSL